MLGADPAQTGVDEADVLHNLRQRALAGKNDIGIGCDRCGHGAEALCRSRPNDDKEEDMWPKQKKLRSEKKNTIVKPGIRRNP